MRMHKRVALLALVALMACPGCAAWRARQQIAAADYTPSSTGNSFQERNILQDAADGVSNASLHDWNGKAGRW
jgi:hypothetical protein